jgi:hypothetical protein
MNVIGKGTNDNFVNINCNKDKGKVIVFKINKFLSIIFEKISER